jgi:hypothetical protein
MWLLPMVMLAFAVSTTGGLADGLGQQLRGCWDRVDPWPERTAKLAAEPGAVWDQTICFNGTERLTLDILGGGGTAIDSDGNNTPLGIEGWGELGTYRMKDDRITVSLGAGYTWIAETASSDCKVSIEGAQLLLRDCRGDGAVQPDSTYRRSDWDVGQQFAHWDE